MTAEDLPLELRERMLSAALAARAPGRAVPEIPAISPVEAFSRAADAFHSVLSALAPVQWRVPVLRDLDVQGLVGHLSGVEHDLQRALAGDAGVACTDHVGSTQPAATAQRGRATEETHAEWREAVDRTSELVGVADLGQIVVVHKVRLPLGSLLIVRAFELWTHENDIRAAVGLPASAPDGSTLPLMTDLAARLLPHGVARVDPQSIPIDLHLVLTGPGGGTWDLALGERSGDPAADVPDVMIVAGAVGFCRLVANRIGPSDLDPHLSGAVHHVPLILAGAAALALD